MVVTSFSFCLGYAVFPHIQLNLFVCHADRLVQLKINREANMGMRVSDLDSFYK